MRERCKTKYCDNPAEYGKQCRDCYERGQAMQQWGDEVVGTYDDYLEATDNKREFEEVGLHNFVCKEMKKTSRTR